MNLTSSISAIRMQGIRLLIALLLVAPLALGAQQIQVTLNPAQTTIEWTLDATMHSVHGSFKLKSGTLSFDPVSGKAGGEIVVDATSGESGNQTRDKKMHAEVLESKRYPEITFFPKQVVGKVAGEGSSTVHVLGVFHIHGADHEMTVSIPLQKSGSQVKATSSFVIPYQAWGMKDPGNVFLHVAKTVQIEVSSTGSLNGSPGHE